MNYTTNLDTQVAAERINNGQTVEQIHVTVSRMRSCAFLHTHSSEGLQTYSIEIPEWDRIVAEQTAAKYAHES